MAINIIIKSQDLRNYVKKCSCKVWMNGNEYGGMYSSESVCNDNTPKLIKITVVDTIRDENLISFLYENMNNIIININGELVRCYASFSLKQDDVSYFIDYLALIELGRVESKGDNVIISKIKKLNNEIADLSKEIEKLNKSLEKKEEEFAKDYDYALLIKDYKPVFYNNGRKEERVTNLKIQINRDDIPEISIEKI